MIDYYFSVRGEFYVGRERRDLQVAFQDTQVGEYRLAPAGTSERSFISTKSTKYVF
jgi:hypothetical protein